MRFAVVAACCVAVSCSCTTVLACLVDVTSRNSLARENSSGILPKCARNLLATAVDISEESESLTCWKRADASHGRNESFISNNAFIQEN
jgi:hypothetical protein